MINPISLKANCSTQGLIGRHPWMRLWTFCRTLKSKRCGIVEVCLPEILTLLDCSRATLYRWLKEGREAGAFKYYKKIGKFEMKIILGGKRAVCKNLGITDWGSVTEMPLWMILGKGPNGDNLKQWTTQHQTYWMQKRSEKAAKQEETKKVRNKRYRRKPYKAKFNRTPQKPKPRKLSFNRTPQKPKLRKLSGATEPPTPQYMQPTRRDKRERKQDERSPKPIKKTAFSRHHLPTGASQKGIAESLRVSDRTVRRHLAKIERVQVMYKVNCLEGQATLFEAQENWKKAPVFERQGEYYRYGCNLYNLEFTQKSEFTQRLKYKFLLFKETAATEILGDKKTLSYADFLNLFSKFNLDSLDEICLSVLFEMKSNSFKEFLSLTKNKLKELKRWKHKKTTPQNSGR